MGIQGPGTRYGSQKTCHHGIRLAVSHQENGARGARHAYLKVPGSCYLGEERESRKTLAQRTEAGSADAMQVLHKGKLIQASTVLIRMS
jgi:hypothetical protein